MISIAPDLPLATWSLEDYHQIVASGVLADRAVELWVGHIVEMVPEGPEHAQLSTDAADYLRRLLGDRAMIRDAKPITLPNLTTEPQPDLAIVAPQRMVYRTRHPEPQEVYWLVEYAKTTRDRDLQYKRDMYAAAGIPEYWVVDLVQSKLWVFRESDRQTYRQVQTFQGGEVSPLQFPEVVVQSDRLIHG